MDDQNPSQPNFQQSPPPQSLDSLHWLKILSTALFAVLVLSTVGIGAYFLGKNQNKPASTVQTSPTPDLNREPTGSLPAGRQGTATASWQTYTNTQYGYSFKYPNDWDIAGEKTLFVAPQSTIDEIKKIEGGFGGGKGLVSTINVYTEKPQIPISDEYQNVTEESVIIGGKQATKYTIQVIKPSPVGNVGDKIINIIIPNNNYYLDYSLLDEKYKPVFDQILSTFRFD